MIPRIALVHVLLSKSERMVSVKASVSKVNTATRCLKKYEYRYVQEIEKILPDARPQLGKIGHSCLEYFYTGHDWTAPVAAYEQELRKLMVEEQAQYAHIPTEIYRMVRGYLAYWKKIDDNIEVLAVELPFEVDTPAGNRYEGIIDLIYRDSEGVWVLDHKFVKKIPEESARYWDAQTNLYMYAAEKLGYNPDGVVFDYIRTKPPTQPKILKSGEVSRAECDTDVQTYLATVRAAGKDPRDYMDMLEKLQHNVFFKRTRLPKPERLIDSILQDFDSACSFITMLRDFNARYTRSINRDCSWDCEYYDLCTAELSGINAEYVRVSNFKPKEARDNGEQNDD